MSNGAGGALGALPPVQAVAASAAIGDPRQQALGRALQTMLGQTVPVQVLKSLPEGGFMVRVAGQEARMALAPDTLPGSVLPMKVLQALPQATFQLGTADLHGSTLIQAQAMPMAAAAEASGTGMPASAAPVPADAGAAPTTLSATAKALSAVLASALGAPSRPTSVVGATPLVAGEGIVPERLAAALGQAVSHSGLFYESHLAAWSEGKRDIDELAREPQMQRSASAVGHAAGKDQAGVAALVDLQLTVLEQARIQWQGQLFPGQPMHWTIEKDAPDGAPDHAQPDSDSTSWRSGLRLHFPRLGDIDATVIVSGEQVRIKVRVGHGDTRALLLSRSAELSEAFDAAGSRLTSLRVEKAGPPS